MQRKEFLVSFWTKGLNKFSKKSFWFLILTFLWDSAKRSIQIFWMFYVLTIIFICYVIRVILLIYFFRLDNFSETCKSLCKSVEWVSVWELVDGSFLSKIALTDRQSGLAFCNSFCFCFFLRFCDGILRGTNIKKKNNFFDIDIILTKLTKQTLY